MMINDKSVLNVLLRGNIGGMTDEELDELEKLIKKERTERRTKPSLNNSTTHYVPKYLHAQTVCGVDPAD